MSSNPSLLDLPDNVVDKIFKYALTASMNGTTGQVFLDKYDDDFVGAKKIAVGLLRTSHEVYHRARKFLYSENELVFFRWGEDLEDVAKPLGLSGCDAEGCNMTGPVFDHVVFNLGDNHSVNDAADNIYRFGKTIEELHRAAVSITINHLTLNFCKFNWDTTCRPFMIAQALKTIKVNNLVFSGDISTAENYGHDYSFSNGDVFMIPFLMRLTGRCMRDDGSGVLFSAQPFRVVADDSTENAVGNHGETALPQITVCAADNHGETAQYRFGGSQALSYEEFANSDFQFGHSVWYDPPQGMCCGGSHTHSDEYEAEDSDEYEVLDDYEAEDEDED